MESKRHASAFDRYLREVCGGNAADLQPDDPFRLGMKIAENALEVFRKPQDTTKRNKKKTATNSDSK